MLRRHREERHAGRTTADALRVTARTSGRVVVFSGLTVVLCLTGLLFTGLGVFRGDHRHRAGGRPGHARFGDRAARAAFVAGRPGRRTAPAVVRPRPDGGAGITGVGLDRDRGGEAASAWGGLATFALLLTAAPALEMHLQDAAITQSLPREVPAVDAALRMGEAFPGMPTPARVVAVDYQIKKPRRTWPNPALSGNCGERVRQRWQAMFEPVIATPVGDTTVIRVPLAGARHRPGIERRALEYLRNEVLPATLCRKRQSERLRGRRPHRHPVLLRLRPANSPNAPRSFSPSCWCSLSCSWCWLSARSPSRWCRSC